MTYPKLNSEPSGLGSSNYWCVVPAAGTGRRFNAQGNGNAEGSVPKQYASVLGKPVADWTLQALLSFKPFNTVVVSIAKEDAWFHSLAAAKDPRLLVCEGGSDRWRSVLFGLEQLASRALPTDWVFVHDIARPCVTSADLVKLQAFCQAQEEQETEQVSGAVLGIPVSDSLKRVRSDLDADHQPMVTSSVDRSGLWQAYTPQVARFGDLLQALRTVALDQRRVNDEAEALELLGKSVVMIQGAPDNIKVTYPGDLNKVVSFFDDVELDGVSVDGAANKES